MRHAILSMFVCAALTGVATSQSASFTPFGSSCKAPEGSPTIGNSGLPVLGQSFDVTYTGPNQVGGTYGYQPHLVIGLNLFGPGFEIPSFLFSNQPMGCKFYVSHDIVLPMPLSPLVRPAYESSFTFDIPSEPVLLGASFFVQWMTVYTQCGIVPPCWVGWVTTSEAGIATIGN